MARLLVVEDHDALGALLHDGLARAGFAIDHAPSLLDAEDYLRDGHYALIILDLGLPDGDGLKLLRMLRGAGDSTPVLILSARGGVQDRIQGIDLGADDYLGKPFDFKELLARIRALLRRPAEYLGRALHAGNLTLDIVARQALVAEKPVQFSARDIDLLELLMRRSGRVIPKAIVETHLFSLSTEPRSNAVEVYVHRLRKQLADAGADVSIHTIRGVGYLLSESKV